jgi:hypothetical protein
VLDKRVGGGGNCSGYWRIASGELVVEFVADRFQLTLLELGNSNPAPTLGGADQCRIDELQDGTLAEGVGPSTTISNRRRATSPCTSTGGRAVSPTRTSTSSSSSSAFIQRVIVIGMIADTCIEATGRFAVELCLPRHLGEGRDRRLER